MDANEIVTAALRPSATAKTAAFNAKLAPTVAPQRFLGVKSAGMKATSTALLAGDLGVTAAEFRAATPHPYVELDIVHTHTLNAIHHPAQWREACEAFLPFIDNWMVTDSLDPAILRRRRPRRGQAPATGENDSGGEAAASAISAAHDWLAGQPSADDDAVPAPYTIRSGIIVLMRALQHGYFSPEHLEWVAGVRHSDYYVHMAVGWYFATAFDACEDATRPFLEDAGPLQLEAHRLAIRKIIESRKTSPDNLTWARAKRTQLRKLAQTAQSVRSIPLLDQQRGWGRGR